MSAQHICTSAFFAIFALAFSLPSLAWEQGQEIRLWPNGAPGSEHETAPEVFTGNPQLPNRFTVTYYPSVYVFLPPKDKANGMGIVIAPGGGHTSLVMDKEGYAIAHWCNDNGIAAFVLKYRLFRAPGSHYTLEKDVLADAARSVRLVRSRASGWGVDPHRIGFMGFSAGGQLAAMIDTRFDAGDPNASDPIDRFSSRPDFAVIVYPGMPPDGITVPKDTPPTFLVCADDDPSHVVATVNIYLALQKQGISSEMHIYATGKHGFAMREKNIPVATWPDRLLDWMKDKKLLQ